MRMLLIFLSSICLVSSSLSLSAMEFRDIRSRISVILPPGVLTVYNEQRDDEVDSIITHVAIKDYVISFYRRRSPLDLAVDNAANALGNMKEYVTKSGNTIYLSMYDERDDGEKGKTCTMNAMFQITGKKGHLMVVVITGGTRVKLNDTTIIDLADSLLLKNE